MSMGSSIWMIVVWMIVIGMSIWLLTILFPKTTHLVKQNHADNDALTTLQQRYANGELSKEEFETLRTQRFLK